MDLSWNDPQIALQKKFAEFGRAEVAPRAQALSKANAFDHQSWEKLCATEFWRLVIPVEYGGLGENWWDFSAALEGLSQTAADGGFIMSVIGHAGFIRGLTRVGTPAQKARCFPLLLSGTLTAMALAEPHSGTDMADIRSEVIAEGDITLLVGEKYNIAHAPTAGLAMVLARMSDLGKSDRVALLLEGDRPGIVRGPAQEKMGNRTIPTSWLKFERVEVRKQDILGNAGDGLKVMLEGAALSRVYYGWMGGQLLRPLLDAAMERLSERQSFNKPMASRQHVQRKLVDVAAGIAQSRWSGIGALDQLLKGDAEALFAGSVAKLKGTEGFLENAQALMSLFGSDGYLEGLASHLFRDAAGWITAGGTAETHRINIFSQMKRLRR